MKKIIFIYALVFTFNNAISQLSWTTTSNFTFNTSYGNIQLGPFDGSYGHIYTDRSRFLFNKDIYSQTGGFSSMSGVGLSFKTNGTTRIYINPTTGYIGFGTITPMDFVHFNTNLLIGVDKRLKFGTEYSGSGSLQIFNSSGAYGTYFDFDGNIFFRRQDHNNNNLGAIMGLQNNGTVTIGVWEKYDNTVTDTQGARLMVNGGILCEKVKVIADVPNSDFVFEPTYKLMPLDELKLFVQNNRHLPEIPSAEEFKNEGYNLGQMDDLLLRKIEELTLYIIQLEEMLKKQQVQIEELKK
jgi:hypothetical protein